MTRRAPSRRDLLCTLGLLPLAPIAGAEPQPVRFTDVAAQAGLARARNLSGDPVDKQFLIEEMGGGVALFDFDNDGFDDLFVSYWGRNVLYHNNGNGTFTNVSEKAGVAGPGGRWGAGCCFLDYDRDGRLDLFVANYVHFDPKQVPRAGEAAY